MNLKSSLIRLASLLFVSSLLLIGCDSSSSDDGIDVSDPSSLAGTYDWVSITDKTGDLFDLPNQTLVAGEDNQVTMTDSGQSITVVFNISGTMTFTTSRFTMVTNTSVTIPGFGTQSDSDTDTGSYTVSGSTMSLVSDNDEDEGPDSLTLSADGNRLTMEDADIRLILEKR